MVLHGRRTGGAVWGEVVVAFAGAVGSAAGGGPGPGGREIREVVPGQCLSEDGRPAGALYARVLAITDFVSGMTDSYAVAVVQKLRALTRKP